MLRGKFFPMSCLQKIAYGAGRVFGYPFLRWHVRGLPRHCVLLKFFLDIVCFGSINKIMKVVTVRGIYTPNMALYGLKRDLRKEFPESDGNSHTDVGCLYNHWSLSFGRIQKMVSELQDERRGRVRRILIIAHSAGGLVSKAAIAESGNPDNVDLVTMNTAHGYSRRSEKMKEHFGIEEQCPRLLCTVGAIGDSIVPNGSCSVDGIHHHDISGWEDKGIRAHGAVLISKSVRKEVFEFIRRHLDE